MNELYRKQVGLLIRILPSVYQIEDFALHGGTAINLFLNNLPRFSIDIDLTYIPIENRLSSMSEINNHLARLKTIIEKTIPGIKIIHKVDVWKLICNHEGLTVKIEVNGIKRGLLGNTEDYFLCHIAQTIFNSSFKARIVSYTQLYGGKISAALNRQHPRDLFDCQFMSEDSLGKSKDGLILSLLGSDKPIIESLKPNLINQQSALENQFTGMTDKPFTYKDYTESRERLIMGVNNLFNTYDKDFIISFENGEPKWEICCAGDLSIYPSVQWKLENIRKLKTTNPNKFKAGLSKLEKHLSSR